MSKQVILSAMLCLSLSGLSSSQSEEPVQASRDASNPSQILQPIAPGAILKPLPATGAQAPSSNLVDLQPGKTLQALPADSPKPETSSLVNQKPAPALPPVELKPGALPAESSVTASGLRQEGVGRTGRPILRGPVSLSNALEIGLANSLGVSLATSEVETARANTLKAGSEGQVAVATDFQKVRGEAGRMWDASPTLNTGLVTAGAPETLGVVRARVSYPIWGGAFGQRMAAADAAEKRAMARLALSVRDSARKIRRGYFQVLLERERLQVAVDELKAREVLVELSREKLKAGKVAPFVVNRHESELAAAEQRLNVARAGLTSAEAALKATLGIEVSSILSYPDEFEIPPPSGAQEQLLAEALDNRPDLVAARYGVEEGAHRVDAASADYGPQLNLGAQYSTIGNGGLAADSSYVGQFSTGLTLSVPLFDGGNQEAEVSRAQALKKSRELQLADLELEVTRQVVDVQARYQAAEANQKLSEDARLRAEEDLRISTMRYEVGQGDPMEVLDTLTATSRMRLSAVQAAYDANVLYADLLYFTGRL
ncbi:MAG: hypothetical protein AMXMBFR33_59490 [Candidatus Xenobia bacterium]